jgi:nitroimidazol reductase NimA-like FMN-containing flavoprotein (pyridoxamine 5'-phosphate oxidase superfamily)
MMTERDGLFPRTSQNTIKRLPQRGHYDRAIIYPILDAAFVCHVAFVQDGQPFIIPTLYARQDDSLLLHGATTSRMLRHAESGGALSIAVTLVDGIVLARSVFHHSINYRSVVAFGHGHLVDEPEAKAAALAAFTEKLLPGRWDDARSPNSNESKATAVIAVEIESASAKIRSGPPGDDEEDLALPVWAGVLPVTQHFGAPIPAPELSPEIPLPEYLRNYLDRQNPNVAPGR